MWGDQDGHGESTTVAWPLAVKNANGWVAARWDCEKGNIARPYQVGYDGREIFELQITMRKHSAKSISIKPMTLVAKDSEQVSWTGGNVVRSSIHGN